MPVLLPRVQVRGARSIYNLKRAPNPLELWTIGYSVTSGAPFRSCFALRAKIHLLTCAREACPVRTISSKAISAGR